MTSQGEQQLHRHLCMTSFRPRASNRMIEVSNSLGHKILGGNNDQQNFKAISIKVKINVKKVP